MAHPPAPRTVAVLTLGCKLNQAESEAIARELQGAGWRVIDRPAAAHAFVINSCSITHVADRKSRHLVRLARRLAPEATVVLTGCYPETAGHDAAYATGADLVVPSRDKSELVRRLSEFRALPVTVEGHGTRSARDPETWNLHGGAGRTRAFVKAQEGCNDVCAFCIVPRTRGRERSVPPEEVVAAVAARAAEGVQEVVITGTQLGAYGRDRDARAYGPAALIRAVLAETDVPRIRFSSLQPQDITPELLALWEDPRLCRHFHLALQSGSDAVLRRMRRRYTLDQYRAALALIRARVPDVAVTTDIIVGFPGETAAEAAASLAFCREAGFAQMHIFPYSRRPGTSAHLLRDHVPEPVKRARMQEMLACARETATAFRRRYLGRTLVVLWEGPAGAAHGGAGQDSPEEPLWEGLTDNYIRVYTRTSRDLRNRLTPVYLRDEAVDGLHGVPWDGNAPPTSLHRLATPVVTPGWIPLTVVERA